MSIKRFAEFRSFPNREDADAYRASYKFYSEKRLLLFSFFYAMSCALFLGVFLVKYRIELLLSLPFIAVLFTWYFHMSFESDSAVQYPEKLHKKLGFSLYCLFVVLLFMGLLFFRIPALHWLLYNAFIDG